MNKEIKHGLDLFIKGLQNLLGQGLVAVYAHGSLSLGTFEDPKSDIDIVVVLDRPLNSLDPIRILHQDLIKEAGILSRLEVSYLPLEDFISQAPPLKPRPYYNQGQLTWAAYGPEWYFEQDTLYRAGVLLAGKSLKDQLVPRSYPCLHQAALASLKDWDHKLDQGSLSSAYVVYGLLTLSRLYYLLEVKGQVSKQEAGRWMMDLVGLNHKKIIQAAMSWQGGPFPYTNEGEVLMRTWLKTRSRGGSNEQG